MTRRIKSIKEYTNSSIMESLKLNEAEITNEDLAGVLSALPELEKLIKKHIGMNVKLQAELKPGRRNSYIQISSGDLIKDYGNNPIVKASFASWKIDFLGGTKNSDNEIWFNPNCAYTHYSGGSNGTQFIWDSIWYKEGKWVEGRVIV